MSDHPADTREQALAAALAELLAAADNCVTSDDDVAAMLRYGHAVETAAHLVQGAPASVCPTGLHDGLGVPCPCLDDQS